MRQALGVLHGHHWTDFAQGGGAGGVAGQVFGALGAEEHGEEAALALFHIRAPRGLAFLQREVCAPTAVHDHVQQAVAETRVGEQTLSWVVAIVVVVSRIS